jgi:hypothetical protein
MTIDVGDTPTEAKALLVRGLASVEIVDGVPDEYVASSTKALGADQVTEFERQVRSMYDQMARTPSSRCGRGSSTSVRAACRPS